MSLALVLFFLCWALLSEQLCFLKWIRWLEPCQIDNGIVVWPSGYTLHMPWLGWLFETSKFLKISLMIEQWFSGLTLCVRTAYCFEDPRSSSHQPATILPPHPIQIAPPSHATLSKASVWVQIGLVRFLNPPTRGTWLSPGSLGTSNLCATLPSDNPTWSTTWFQNHIQNHVVSCRKT